MTVPDERLQGLPGSPGIGAVAVSNPIARTGPVTLALLTLLAAGLRRLGPGTSGLMQYLAPRMAFTPALLFLVAYLMPDHAVILACVPIVPVLYTRPSSRHHRLERFTPRRPA